MAFINRKGSVEEVGNHMVGNIHEILDRASIARPRVVVTEDHTATFTPRRMPSIWNAASWLRSLTYEDMMQVASEINSIRGDEVIDTPDKFAKLIHAWSKTTTDRNHDETPNVG